MPEAQPVWVLVSKGAPWPAAGIYPACPSLRCGRSSPPIPFAIQCVSRAEATALFRLIRPVLATLSDTPSTSELLNAFGAAEAVRNFFRTTNAQFFVVVVGSPPGIHRSRESAERTRGQFSQPYWRQQDTFWEALAFLIVKGVDDLMPPFDTTPQISPDLSPDPSDSLSEDMDFLERDVQINLCLSPSSTQPRMNAARQVERVRDSEPTMSTPATQGARGGASQSQMHTPADEETRPAPTPFVYVHIRTLRGILQSTYYATLPVLDEAQVNAVGPQASRYLIAHGYTAETVAIIIRTREVTGTSSHQFALQLAAHGMAFEEAIYLHGLFE